MIPEPTNKPSQAPAGELDSAGCAPTAGSPSSDTPESDAAWDYAWDEGGCHEEHLLDTMQKLERERNAAKAKAKAEFEIATGYHNKWQQAEKRLAMIYKFLRFVLNECDWEPDSGGDARIGPAIRTILSENDNNPSGAEMKAMNSKKADGTACSLEEVTPTDALRWAMSLCRQAAELAATRAKMHRSSAKGKQLTMEAQIQADNARAAIAYLEKLLPENAGQHAAAVRITN